MIWKVLTITVVLFFVYILFFRKGRDNQVNSNKRKKDEIEDIMVECPTCGTYVSKKEAILSNGQYFCSKECLK